MLNKIVVLILVFAFAEDGFSQIYNKPKPVLENVWDSDSVFIGAGLIANGENIVVNWDTTHATRALGELYFVVPGYNDSLKFLFHNFINDYPNENRKIDLGKYSKGTPIIFMYRSVDTSSFYTPYYFKKVYSGQNRIGTDYYISELYNSIYKHCYSASARSLDGLAEIGLSSDLTFTAIKIKVSGTFIEVIEKYKTNPPLLEIDQSSL